MEQEKKIISSLSEPITEVDENKDEDENAAAVDALFAAINKSKATSYRVIIKGDVRGSVEALKDSLELIESEKVAWKLSIVMLVKSRKRCQNGEHGQC